jgi:biopolymer transport protein ExbD
MQFLARKRRQAPAIIIISLIDILIVLLIFLMVTTTFKQQPALKLSLPESQQKAQKGTSESDVVITVSKDAPYLYLGQRPVTLEKLQTELNDKARVNSKLSVSIRPDKDAPVGEVIKVMDAAKAAHLERVSLGVKPAGNER